MKRIIINTIVFFFSMLAFPQGEANIWYFGQNAGLDFNSGTPVPLLNGQINTLEGCAVLSNNLGQLLFYTDGVTIYNRNHNIMLNGTGLLGHPSTTQSATIVPKPGDPNLFYVFTIDRGGYVNGFRYSIIDLTLDVGLGGVTTDKNVLVYTPTCEKISIVKHANNTDYWIVTHGYPGTSFYTHLLTSTGMNTTPVVSNVGVFVPNNDPDHMLGYMKFSPAGNKLAVAHFILNTLQLFDFNNTTGALSNPITLIDESITGTLTNALYGLEFSPNGKVLYVGRGLDDMLFQFDLTAANIPASKFDYTFINYLIPSALQLGPDGKIYIAHQQSAFLSVISNPNTLGIGCAIQEISVPLGGRLCLAGLPSFSQSFLYSPSILLSFACEGEPSNFSFSTNQTVLNVSWNFGDGTISNSIAPAHTYTSSGNYNVTVTVTTPQGTATNSRNITIYPQPTLLTNIVTLKQCDDNNDGYSAFNLTETIPLLMSNPTGFTTTFHETLTQAQDESSSITNVTYYSNQIINNDIVYVRVENANGCYQTAQLNLQVSTTSIPTTFQLTYHECDDVISGAITDGIATFNFSDAESQVRALYPSGQLLDVTFYKNLADALSESNKITNTSNYSNIGYPNTQNIYIRVDSQINNECLGLGQHITLKVDRIPIVQSLKIRHCDDNQDGVFAFDTTNLESTLLNGLTNVIVTYSDSNGNPIVFSNPFAIASQIINAKVKNNYGMQCEYNTTIQFIVDDLPQAYAIPIELTTVCDDKTNLVLQNGSYSFNTLKFQSTILGSQTGMIVNYYDINNNPLSSPLPNPFVTTQQNVSVEVINLNNNTCKATMTIPFVINSVPNINLYGSELICSDNPSFTKVIDAGLVDTSTISNYTYTWFLNNNLIPGKNQYSLIVNTEGIYTVEVKNAQGCNRTRTITVTASNLAIIDSVVVNDFIEENSITILLSAASLGSYEYSLDNINYQTSNLFTNIMPGIYTVYVKDLKGCGITPKDVNVLGIPKCFTPNGDGFNDFWNIKGINSNFSQNASIHVFDRFGKLLKQISPLSQGWDGKFNGQNLPSEDYWYVIKLQDDSILKGHFALKR